MTDQLADSHTGGGNGRGTRARFGSVRKLPSGRYQARYTGPDSKAYPAPTTFQTKRDALDWLALQSAAITSEKWRPTTLARNVPSLGPYGDKWISGRELKPRTRAEYRRLWSLIIDALGADAPLPTITRDKVRDFYQALADRPSTRAHAYGLLKSVLTTAVEDGLIGANPCQIRGGGNAKAQHPIRPATFDELDKIIAEMPGRYGAMVLLAAWCALRFGELTELRRRDLELTPRTGVVHVRRAVTWVGGRPVVGTPKSDAGVRDVAIPPHIIPALRDHLSNYAEPGDEGLVFPAVEGGGQMKHGALYKVFRRARKAAGREDLRWHDLRHTGMTMAAQAGATTRELMERAGHTSAGVAMRYQHVAQGRDAEIARRLSDMAKGKK